MATVRFITSQFIKDNSPVNDNVDNKYLTTGIDLAMSVDLRQLIGTEMYDDLIAEGETASGVIASLPTNYRTLLQMQDFKAFLMWASISRAIVYLTYKIQNKSIATKSSDNATPIEKDDMFMLRDEAKNMTEFYGERIVYFLKENSDDYPQYTECGDISPPTTAYKSPVFIGDRRPKGRRENPNTR